MPKPCVIALLLVLAALLAPLSVRADPVTFESAVDGEFLTITQRGDGIAFHPQAYVLDANGEWQLLPASAPASQLTRDETMRYERPAAGAHPSGVLQVRYFDRNGFGFGQLVFPQAWPGLTLPFPIGLDGERLSIEGVANQVSNTWVLWTARDDERRSRFDATPPPAPPVFLSWSAPPGSDPGTLLIHAISLPSAPGNIVLLHELAAADGTATYAVQHLPPSADGPYSYRPGWLDASRSAYAAAVLFLCLAAAVPAWRRRSVAVRPPCSADVGS